MPPASCDRLPKTSSCRHLLPLPLKRDVARYNVAMASSDPRDAHLRKLRQYRVPKEQDLSLDFLKQQFQRDVAKPYKQLGAVAVIWQQLVPAELAAHTRLEGLSRGVLRVTVDSSAHLYELDRLLRAGLERDIIRKHAGAALRKIKLRNAPLPRS